MTQVALFPILDPLTYIPWSPLVNFSQRLLARTFPDTRKFCSFNMFTKHTDLSSHLGGLQIPNLPAWSSHKPKIDLYVLAFIRRAGSCLIAPLSSIILTWALQPTCTYLHYGSAAATTVGSGVYIESINKPYAITLTQSTSSFSSELYAIFHVLYCPFTYKFMKALILTEHYRPLVQGTEKNTSALQIKSIF